MAKKLTDFQAEFGYPILTPDEVRKVRDHSIKWNSLDGEIIIRKCLKSYPAYLQISN